MEYMDCHNCSSKVFSSVDPTLKRWPGETHAYINLVTLVVAAYHRVLFSLHYWWRLNNWLCRRLIGRKRSGHWLRENSSRWSVWCLHLGEIQDKEMSHSHPWNVQLAQAQSFMIVRQPTTQLASYSLLRCKLFLEPRRTTWTHTHAHTCTILTQPEVRFQVSKTDRHFCLSYSKSLLLGLIPEKQDADIMQHKQMNILVRCDTTDSLHMHSKRIRPAAFHASMPYHSWHSSCCIIVSKWVVFF